MYLSNQQKIRAQNVISVTNTAVTYLDDGQLVTHPHNKTIDDFLQETATYRIIGGRNTDEQFHRIQESIYFLHIRQRNPFTVINLNHTWCVKKLNRGRKLILTIGDNTVEYNCSFPILDDFLDSSFGRC